MGIFGLSMGIQVVVEDSIVERVDGEEFPAKINN